MSESEILENNKAIAEFMGVDPEIEYYIGNGDAICYNPKYVGDYFPTSYSQKMECDRWLKEQHEKYPDGWVSTGGYEVMKCEWWPRYHNDWNLLMPVVENIEKMGYIAMIAKDRCQIGLPTDENPKVSWCTDTKLSATYQAACEFLKQRNHE
jgi:hypothetical protein